MLGSVSARMTGRLLVILAYANCARLGENSRNEIWGCVCTSRSGERSRRGEVGIEGLAQARIPWVERQSTLLRWEVLA